MKKYKNLFVFLFVVLSLFNSISVTHAKEEISVTYLGATEDIFVTSDDFFVNINDILPGDILEDNATLENKSNKTIKLFFKTEPLDKSAFKTDADYDLLEKINLTIETIDEDGTVKEVYKGFLGAKDFTEFKELGIYAPSEKVDFKFKIEIPHELTNTYELAQTRVRWVFGIGEIDDTSAQTGDDANLSIYVATGTCSLVLLLLLLKMKNKKEGDAENV